MADLMSANLQLVSATCAEVAKKQAYIGVTFMYNRSREDVIVQWTEGDINHSDRVAAEGMLYDFFKSRSNMAQVSAAAEGNVASAEAHTVVHSAHVEVTNIKKEAHVEHPAVAVIVNNAGVKSVAFDVGRQSQVGMDEETSTVHPAGDVPVDDMEGSEAESDEKLLPDGLLVDSSCQTEEGMFRRSTRTSRTRMKLEADDLSEEETDQLMMDVYSDDWSGIAVGAYTPPAKRRSTRKYKVRKPKTAGTFAADDLDPSTSQGDGGPRRRIKSVKGEVDELLYCETCGKSFRNPYLLKMHARTHTGERPYQCATCGKTFAQEGNLKTHSFIHTGVKPFGCDQCDKRFAQKVHLKNHMLVHTGEKPHQCEVCGRTFSRPKTLAVHKLSHSDGEVHSCNSCEKTFTSRGLLREHQMVHLDKVHECKVCEKKFSCRNHLTRHALTHTGFKGFECKECGKTFTQNSSLKRHELLHTGSDVKHTCEICGKEFLWKSSWLSHKLTHINKD